MLQPQNELLNTLTLDLDHMISDLCDVSTNNNNNNNNNNKISSNRLSSCGMVSAGGSSLPPEQHRLLHQHHQHNPSISRLQAGVRGISPVHHSCSSCSSSSSCSSIGGVVGVGGEEAGETGDAHDHDEEDDEDGEMGGEDAARPCEMSLSERLIRSHPVWFLPHVHRTGAEHLLQGKQAGSFIVRQSSKGGTMALSVRLSSSIAAVAVVREPAVHVQHYLIEVHNTRLSLETLSRSFDNISSLVTFYCTYSGELPVLLRLPDSLMRAESRQQLASLALLGQDFWLSRWCSDISSSSSSTSSSPASVSTGAGLTCNTAAPNVDCLSGVQCAAWKTSSVNGSDTKDTTCKMMGTSTSAASSTVSSSCSTSVAQTDTSTSVLGAIEEEEDNAGSAPDTVARQRPTPPCSLPLWLGDTRNVDNGEVTRRTGPRAMQRYHQQLRSPGLVAVNRELPVSSASPSSPASAASTPAGCWGASQQRASCHVPPRPPPRWCHSSSAVQSTPSPPSPAEAHSVLTNTALNIAAIASASEASGSRRRRSRACSPAVAPVLPRRSPVLASSTNMLSEDHTEPVTARVRTELNVFLGGSRQVRSAACTPVSSHTTVTARATPACLTPASCDDEVLTASVQDNEQKTDAAVCRERRRRFRRKRSTHYQEADIPLNAPVNGYCGSSLADKMSDYEDIWVSSRSSPSTSAVVVTPSSSSVASTSSACVVGSTFRPRVSCEAAQNASARSLNDLTQNHGVQMQRITEDRRAEVEQKQNQRRARCGSQSSGVSSTGEAGQSLLYAVPADAVTKQTAGGTFSASCCAVEEGRSGTPDPLVVSRRKLFERSTSHRHSDPSNFSWDVRSDCQQTRNHSVSALGANVVTASRRTSTESEQTGAVIPRVVPVVPPRVHSASVCSASNSSSPLDQPLPGVSQVVKDTHSQHHQNSASEPQWHMDRCWDYEADTEDTNDSEYPARDSVPRPGVERELSKEEQSRIVHEIVRRSMCLPSSGTNDARSEYDNVHRSTTARSSVMLEQEQGCLKQKRGASETQHVTPGESCKWQSIVRLMTDQLKLHNISSDVSDAVSRNYDDTAESTVADAVSVHTTAGNCFTDTDSFINLAPHTLFTDSHDDDEEDDDDVMKAVDDQEDQEQVGDKHFHLCSDDMVYTRPRMRMLRLHRKSRNTGTNIRDYVFTLASDNSSIFARSITNFIQCTREGSACELHVILRNIRQFINGMKNYLVKHGEADFHNVVLHERNKLCSTEFLNLDAILEGVLEQLVVHPLHDFLRQTFHNNSNSNINDSSNSARAGVSSLCVSCSGADPQMSDFCDSIKSHTALLSSSMGDSLASSSLLLVPRGHSNKTGRVQYPTMGSFAGGFCSASQGRMSRLIRQLQATVSPLDKLELFLHLVAALFENHWPSDRIKSVKTGAEQAEMSRQVSVDEVLARLLNALLVCRASGIEFECEYMSGLVQPVLKTGQCGVYLAILSSAVHVVQAMRLFLDRVNARNHHSPSLHKTLNNNNNTSSSSRGDRGDSSVCSGSSNRGGELMFSTDKITPSATDSASNNSASSHTPKTAVEQQNQSVRVLVPDESRGTIITRTLTATLSTSARELCCLLADKLRISCPLDYALYQLVDGQETLLNDSDCPQQIKLNLAVKQIHCVLAYKRIDAKIAWPTAQL